MRKKLFALAVVGMMVSASGCGITTQAETTAESTVQQTEEESSAVQNQETGETSVSQGQGTETAAESRVLIAYFSRWGNTDYSENVDASTSASIVVEGTEQYGTTGYMAKQIQDVTGGDLYLIQTEKTYSTDFQEVVDQGHQETNEGTLPALKSVPVDMSGYDVIFVGYPVWATDAPRAIHSFLQSYDLTGKTVIPFCTHDGYGAGHSYSTIAGLCPGAETLNGLAVEAEDVPGAAGQVTDWINGLGIAEKLEAASFESAQEAEETTIRITIGDQELTGVLYDNVEARQFISMLPQTISMVGFGGREFYGRIDSSIETEGEGQYSFENGQITYCPANNTAAIFYAQTDRPNLTMEVFPMGIVTSDLSIFDQLSGNIEITFYLAE